MWVHFVLSAEATPVTVVTWPPGNEKQHSDWQFCSVSGIAYPNSARRKEKKEKLRKQQKSSSHQNSARVNIDGCLSSQV